MRGSLDSRLDLHGLPIVVRDRQALQMARELLDAPDDCPIFVDVEALENAALGERESPGEIFNQGEVRRATPRCEASIDEARTVAGRLFYALNWLTERERLRVIKRAAEATRTGVN